METAFFYITAGQTVSLIGSSAVQFALIWWLASETQSPMMLGISGLAAFLPMTFLSPAAEKIGVHMWFLVTGIAIILITICAVLANRKKSRE